MDRQRYIAPESLVTELKLEGVIAVSGEEPNFNGFNEEYAW